MKSEEHTNIVPKDRKYATVATNEKGEQVIKIYFPYCFDLLDKVRSLAGRRYHKEQRCWSAPIHVESIKKLQAWGFDIDQPLLDVVSTYDVKKTGIVQNNIVGLKGMLYPFQMEGVAFIELNYGRALIADEMGLGKTIQALAWLQLHPEARPALIVTPASLKFNWEREIRAWLPNPHVDILSGTMPRRIYGNLIIINYEILRYWIYEIRKHKPLVIITDECHYYKSNSTNRTKAVKLMSKGIPYFLALSGTPILNRPIEGFNAFKIIKPDLFTNYMDFGRIYCAGKYNKFGWNFNGASRMQELHEKLTTTIMIRRLKKDVLPQLPDKTRVFVPIELSNEAEYRAVEKDFISYIRAKKGDEAAMRANRAEQFAKVEILKQLSVKGKLRGVIEWLWDFVEVGGKIVVFVTHRSTLAALMDEFSKIAVKMDGSDTAKEKQIAENRFQNDPKIKMFIGMLDVQGRPAGTGLNLTAASCTATVELQWSPGVHSQAEDRVHRIGQKDAVTSYYLLAINTVEERIVKIIDYKKRVLDATMDGVETSSESLLAELIKSYQTS